MGKINDFLNRGNRHYITNPTQRIGQAYFNALYDIDPVTANRIRSTKDDPFYDDCKLARFIDKVEEIWNE